VKNSCETEISHLDILIEKIRSDGIRSAEKEAQRIRDEAKMEGQQIIFAAQKEADRLILEAQNVIQKKEGISRKALEFALRDAILQIRSSLDSLMKHLLQIECTKVFDESLFKSLILKMADQLLGFTPEEKISIQLSQEDHRNLATKLYTAITSEIQGGLEIKPCLNLKAGIRISKSEAHYYYDFSDESIAETLAGFLSLEIKEILDQIRNGKDQVDEC
jgi:vacuolar-type H+-ATPase subunit E/Vma4